MRRAEGREFPRSPLRSPGKVRTLDARALVGGLLQGTLPIEIRDDDERFLAVTALLRDYAGVIFAGPPGTSKTWYAAQIAAKLTAGDAGRVRFLQFHPSYQYEDFVEGYVPRDDGRGFVLKPKHLVEACEQAERDHRLHVIVIDEINRGDPGRIFGDALTYVERTKRGVSFRLASGRELAIPDNIAFLATMNPFDRGVDEVDAAFERRFAKIPMDPDEAILREFLMANKMDASLQERVVRFFRTVKDANNPHARIGHTYFLHVRDESDLQRLWNNQLRFVFEKAFPLDPKGLDDVKRAWSAIFAQAAGT